MRSYTRIGQVVLGTLWLGGCAQFAGLTEDYYEGTGSAGEADAAVDTDGAQSDGTPIDSSPESDAPLEGGACEPGSRACSGSSPKECGEDGTWHVESPCAYVCTGDGACTGECKPGAKQCDGKTPEVCNGSGRWESQSPCPNVCSGGACVAACVDGQKQCSNLVPQTCEAGVWHDGQTCPYVCDGGTCVGVCKPNSKQCSGSTPQTCDASGQWQSGSACPHGCNQGMCLPDPCTGVSCTPPAPICVNAGTLRTCSSSTCVNGTCQAVCTDTACSHGCSGGQCTTPTCNPLCGPLEECYDGKFCTAKLVGVTGGFAIDATEVTCTQYEAWLGTNPAVWGQDSHCGFNTSYTPSCAWPPGTKGNHPVGCVDWCDAYAYCKGVGKRLCGRIGGGPNAYEEYASASTSQWYAACSSGGTGEYPSWACNVWVAGSGTDTTVPVGSMSACQSSVPGYAGVYDLTGNVSEWEDSCNGVQGADDVCQLRGGSYGSYHSSCDLEGGRRRGAQDGSFDGIGFRCCSSP